MPFTIRPNFRLSSEFGQNVVGNFSSDSMPKNKLLQGPKDDFDVVTIGRNHGILDRLVTVVQGYLSIHRKWVAGLYHYKSWTVLVWSGKGKVAISLPRVQPCDPSHPAACGPRLFCLPMSIILPTKGLDTYVEERAQFGRAETSKASRFGATSSIRKDSVDPKIQVPSNRSGRCRNSDTRTVSPKSPQDAPDSCPA
jgi:hypothetical protein